MRICRGSCLVAAALVLGGCGILGPDEEEVLGAIEFYGDPFVLEAPDTVTAGEEFTASVRTYGGGCITKGSMSVSIEGQLATLVPVDIQSSAGVCTLELRLFSHSAGIRFDGRGDAVIRVQGRKEPGGEVVTRERSIWVR